jgi:hypothetical protein
MRSILRSIAGVAIAITVAACQGAATPPRTFQLQTLNSSGVTGSVTLEASGADKTIVTVAADVGEHVDMPAHIHPGSCAALVPQPKFPLQNVQNGKSTTTVPVPMAELLKGDLAVNIHRSNADMATYTACADLR